VEHRPNFDAPDLPTLCPKFHHINLKTNRLQEMIDWYATVVGTRVTFQRDDIAFITNDEANHRIALWAGRPLEEPADVRFMTGLHHTAFEYRSLDELLVSWTRLERDGILPKFCLDHGPTTSFYYEDPDGNHVELQSDNWDNSLQSGQFMHADPMFLEDPIGKPVDPPKLIEARKRGMSAWDIHVAAYANEMAPAVLPEIA
jgi:catechol-2,3-dioxygenase